MNTEPFYDDGAIRIFCGDCREILPTVPDLRREALLLTDPPYGIGLAEHGRNGYDWNIRGDENQEVGNEVVALFEGRPRIVFASPQKPWRGKWRQFLVWDKGPTVGGGGDRRTCWKFTWELIQVADTGELTGRRETSVLSFHITQRDYALHPNQKPVALLSYLLRKTADPSLIIVDPFMGCGSTLRAAKNLGLRAIGIETERRYCEIARRRLRQEMLPIFEANDG